MDALSCPLTLKYLASIEKRFDGATLFHTKLPRFYFLRELAECAGNARVRMHQRAFLAVEIMATRGLSSAFNIGIPRVASLRWGKSASGIACLLGVLREEREELIAGQVEFLMDNSVDNKGPEQLVNAKARRQIEYLTWLEDSAKLLRRSLRAGFITQALAVIGPRLSDSTHLLGVDAQLDIAQELLDQTENVERRAWDPKIQLET